MENTPEGDSQPAGLPRRGERREAARSNPASKGASKASVLGSTGVDQDRGMCEEKRKNDRPEEEGTLNSGRRMAPDVGEIYIQRPNDFQPIERVAKSHQESDLPIVVRDGNTDHMAKDYSQMAQSRSDRRVEKWRS